MLHSEPHLVSHIAWLRTPVLDVNDGTLAAASVMVGMAAASALVFSIGAAKPLAMAVIPPADW